MTKKNKFLIIFIFVLFALIVLNETKQRRINWYPSYSVNHKIPYGTYIFHKEAKKKFPKLQDIKTSPYVFFQKNNYAKGNYIIYNSNLNFGKSNLNELLYWVKQGNRLFLFSNYYEQRLLDTLHIYMEVEFLKGLNNYATFNWLNPKFNNNNVSNYKLKGYKISYFKQNSDNIENPKVYLINKIIIKQNTSTKVDKILSNLSNDSIKIFPKSNDSLFNFIKVKFGKGEIFLNSFPRVVTNHFLLQNNNYHYMERIFAYINNGKKVFWDVHFQNGTNSKGIFSILLENPSFLLAYRLAFFGLLFYILFEGKRKQRPIPVIEPFKNETVSFTKTIAEMYLENKEHYEMAQIRIKLFLDWIRTHLHLDVRNLDNDLMKKIAQKTKNELIDVKNIFEMINYLNTVQVVRAKDVLKLEQLINKIIKK